jgi:hypothetical protein
MVDNKNNCTFCNDETQMKLFVCYRCSASWEESESYMDRVATYSQHRNKNAALNSGVHNSVSFSVPILCTECKERGFYIEPEKGTNRFNPRYVIKCTQNEESDKTEHV